jgi:hypothetical protein
MAQVRWSLTAGNDLQDIEDFIARDSILHSITFVDRIIEFTGIDTGAWNHFPARGEDLVCVVSLVCLAQRTNYTG